MPQAVGLAEALLDELGTSVKELTLIPSGGGAFEVTVDGRLIYSKKRTGRHPTIKEIKDSIRY